MITSTNIDQLSYYYNIHGKQFDAHSQFCAVLLALSTTE